MIHKFLYHEIVLIVLKQKASDTCQTLQRNSTFNSLSDCVSRGRSTE